jgi:hypothetical protein
LPTGTFVGEANIIPKRSCDLRPICFRVHFVGRFKLFLRRAVFAVYKMEVAQCYRPLTLYRYCVSERPGGPLPRRVNRAFSALRRILPVFPDKQTFAAPR